MQQPAYLVDEPLRQEEAADGQPRPGLRGLEGGAGVGRCEGALVLFLVYGWLCGTGGVEGVRSGGFMSHLIAPHASYITSNSARVRASEKRTVPWPFASK